MSKELNLSAQVKAHNSSNSMALEEVPITEIRLPDRVVKPPTKRGIATAKAILGQWGPVMPLLISDDGTLMAGFELHAAAHELELVTIKAVRVSSLTEADRRALTIALARLPELSKWDAGALQTEFKGLLSLDLEFDLHDLTGFTIGELDVVLKEVEDEDKPDPADDIPEPPPPGHVVSRLGDVFMVGKHRILCGTCLEAGPYQNLLREDMARMLFSDPPYGIRIRGNVSRKHEDFAMGVGEQSRPEFTAFLETMIRLACRHLADGALAYLFMDRRHLLELQQAAEQAGLTLLDLCIWNKLSGGMGGLYRSQHEPIYVFKHGKASYINNVELGKHGRYRTNVWDHRGLSSFGKGRDSALADHPTVKPVNLLAEAIKDSTRRGDIVLDPFAGSGSTLVAAEGCGRVGYGIELEPKYVDVTVRRLEALTGKQAIHEASGLTFAQVRRRRLRQSASAITTHDPATAS